MFKSSVFVIVISIIIAFGKHFDTDKLPVTITTYQAVESQTDDTPTITADGTHIKDGDQIIAVSRDLLKVYPYGTLLKVQCDCPYNNKTFYVHDTMNKRFTNYVDVLAHKDDPLGKWGGYVSVVESP